MTGAAPGSDREIQNLNQAQATRLLRLGLTDTSSVVGNLTYRLHSKGGKAWFEDVIKAATGFSDAELLSGRADLSRLEVLKNEGKIQFASSGEFDEQLRGMLCYFIAVALAKDQFDMLISTRPGHELSVALLDLAGELPEAWTELLGRVALALDV